MRDLFTVAIGVGLVIALFMTIIFMYLTGIGLV